MASPAQHNLSGWPYVFWQSERQMEVIDPNNRYYVYTLAYPDGTVFYVGKGTGGRILAHESEAQRQHRRGQKCRKCDVIRGIWKDGGQVQRAIVFRTNDQNAAYLKEKELIQVYGFDQLCNADPRLPVTPWLKEIYLSSRGQNRRR